VMESTAASRSWKQTFLRAAGWGFGFGVGVVIVGGTCLWFWGRPKGWDTGALRAKNIKAEGIGHAKEHDNILDVDAMGTAFTFDLENTTREDVTLSPGVRIMLSNKETKALSDSSLLVAKDYFLPSKQSVSVTIQNSSECTESMKTDACFDAIFKGASEIVIFDESAKREIRLPIPPFTRTKDGGPQYIKTD
jgi:hypothetical protein